MFQWFLKLIGLSQACPEDPAPTPITKYDPRKSTYASERRIVPTQKYTSPISTVTKPVDFSKKAEDPYYSAPTRPDPSITGFGPVTDILLINHLLHSDDTNEQVHKHNYNIEPTIAPSNAVDAAPSSSDGGGRSNHSSHDSGLSSDCTSSHSNSSSYDSGSSSSSSYDSGSSSSDSGSSSCDSGGF